MVARTAASSSRAEGVAAALGMGVGGVIFAIAALAGLQGLLLAVPSLYLVLKVAGGLYLAYLGARIWLGATQPLSVSVAAGGEARTVARAAILGVATQVSNPKTAIVYVSVFAAFMPKTPSFALGAEIVALVFAIETSWYSLVALALSAEGPRNAYLRYKSWVDRMAGGVMVALGLKLASSAHSA